MIKVSVSDIVAILRRFELASDDTIGREVDQIVRKSPDDQSTLVSFRYKKTRFYILLDHRANDEQEYILDIIKEYEPTLLGDILTNPHATGGSYGLPFKGKEVYLFEVSTGKDRLDIELTKRYPELSRSTVQKYIKGGQVTVNGTVISQTKHGVSATDDISLTQMQPSDFSNESLPIIYIDENVIVVNKPIGVLTHSKGVMNDEFTVADFFRRYTTYNIDGNRPGIVHRLDRDTSGVIIGARNPETAEMLQKQFANRKTVKTYAAVLAGVLKNDTAIVDLPIGRNPAHPSMFRVDSKGKAAVTKYDTLAVEDGESFVRLMPRSGRTHQLRVHMSYLNAPILGDVVYGVRADRLYLHAFSLEITIPVSTRKTFTAPLPDEFTKKFPRIEM